MSKKDSKLVATIAAEIAACAEMARADGHGRIANILDNAAVSIRHQNVELARSSIRMARKTVERLEDLQPARWYAVLAAQAFEKAFGAL